MKQPQQVFVVYRESDAQNLSVWFNYQDAIEECDRLNANAHGEKDHYIEAVNVG